MDMFGISSIFCFLIGTLLNIISCAYFCSRKRSHKPITLIYSQISVTDTVICALSLAPMVSYILAGKAGLFGADLPCTLWDILMEVSVRYSLFLVAVLSVCRTRAIISPLQLLSKRKIGLIVGGYLLFLCLQETLPAIALQRAAIYVPQRLSCHFFWLESTFTPFQTMVFKIFTFFGEIGIPMAVGGVTGALCIYSLTEKKHRQDNCVTEVQELKKREATKTIVIVTGACLLLNLPIVSIAIIFIVRVPMSAETILMAVDLASSLVVLNSLFNSLIYFVRIKRMRRFAKRLILSCICGQIVQNEIQDGINI